MNEPTILLPEGIKPLDIAWSYSRISSVKQRRGHGLDRQRDETAEYCERLGLKLVESYTDSGLSASTGANRRRGSLRRILEMVENGTIPPYSHLIVEHLDRISRAKVTDALNVFLSIIRRGIILHTMSDSRIYTEQSVNSGLNDLIISISIMVSSHDETRKRTLRQRATWEDKRRKGAEEKLTAKVPGWLKAERVDGKLAFRRIEEHVLIVERIFNCLADGVGRDKIARILNSEGVPTWGSGRQWHGGSVQKITDTRAVLGEFQPGKTIPYQVDEETRYRRVPDGDPIPNYYPQVISEELFYRARLAADARRAKSVANPGGRKGTVYSNLFGNGLSLCAACRSPMNYRDRGPRSTVVFRCSGNRNGICSNEWRYPYHALEKAVLYWVKELDLAGPEETGSKELNEEIASLTLRRDELKSRISGLNDAIEERKATSSTYERLAQRELDLIKVENCLEKAKDRFTALRMMPKSENCAAEYDALLHKLEISTATEKYAIRAKISQAIREIVLVMLYHRDGKIHLVLTGGAKHYYFDGGSIYSTVDIKGDLVQAHFSEDVTTPVSAPEVSPLLDNFDQIHLAVMAASQNA